MDIALSTFPRAAGAGALLLRVALGTMWLTHSLLLKLATFGIDNLAAWLATQGFAPWLAWPLVLAEAAGGTLILLGVYGRWASLALQPVLIGALVVHAGNGWVFSNPNGGWEYPVFLMAASIAHFLLGDGPYALRPERGEGQAR